MEKKFNNEHGRESSKELIAKLKNGIITTEDLLNILQSTTVNEAPLPCQERLIFTAQGRDFRDQFHTLDDIMIQQDAINQRKQELQREFFFTP